MDTSVTARGLALEVLEEFADAQGLGSLRAARPELARFFAAHAEGLRQSVESLRRAYHARNERDGRCRSCPRPAAMRGGRVLSYCDEHRRQANERAQAVLAQRRAARECLSCGAPVTTFARCGPCRQARSTRKRHDDG